MRWNTLSDLSQLDTIDALSAAAPVLIFKHSTRCSISAAALNRLERNWKDEDDKKITPYFLDLLANRAVSNAIADKYGVEHESPQVLVIDNGKAVYNASHTGIAYQSLMALN